MAIDFERERALFLRSVPAWFERHFGKRLSISTLVRWERDGRRGVKLEVAYVGGQRATSVEALLRFIAATQPSRSSGAASPSQPRVRLTTSSRCGYEKVKARLDAEIGI